MIPGVADRQTLSTMVWEEEVRTLAMMASLILKGSMVYTTKMMKRKKDTCRRRKRTARVREAPSAGVSSLLPVKGCREHQELHPFKK